MHRSKQLGATLLEIMLVLAIASMVVVMSIRYYQAANSSQQANAFLSQVSAVNAAAESLFAGGDLSQVNTTNIAALLGGASKLNTPGGGTITIASSSNSFIGTATLISGSVCSAVKAQLSANARITAAASTGCASANASAAFSWTYDFSK